MEQKPTISVSTKEQVNAAVAEAGGLEKSAVDPKVAARLQKKQEARAKQHWNGVPTRAEVYSLMQETVGQSDERMRVLYVTVRSLSDVLISKGLVTKEELEKRSREIMIELYGEDVVKQAQERIDLAKKDDAGQEPAPDQDSPIEEKMDDTASSAE